LKQRRAKPTVSLPCGNCDTKAGENGRTVPCIQQDIDISDIARVGAMQRHCRTAKDPPRVAG
jgi:hypothetical protein